MAGGVPNGKSMKLLQTGGPLGGVLSASDANLDLVLDFDVFRAAGGAILGSGGIIVADEDTCVVDLTRNLIAFCQYESCGKCFPCRMGMSHLLEVLERIHNLEGTDEDLALMRNIGENMQAGSLCGHGQLGFQTRCPPPCGTSRKSSRLTFWKNDTPGIARSGCFSPRLDHAGDATPLDSRSNHRGIFASEPVTRSSEREPSKQSDWRALRDQPDSPTTKPTLQIGATVNKWISDSFPKDRKHISHVLNDTAENGVHIVELMLKRDGVAPPVNVLLAKTGGPAN